MTALMRLNLLFKNKQFYKGLFAIAVPIMLQNLGNSLVNMVDTVMIGRLGTVELAAVGLGNQVFFLYNLVLFGICSGGSIFTAQFWGKQDLRGIRKNTGLCLVCNLAVAVLFTLGALLIPGRILRVYSRDEEVIAAGVSYLVNLAPSFIPFAVSLLLVLTLRSIEKVKLAMTSTVIALFVNVGLNYALIFGLGPIPKMGVAGAARATVIARILEALILIVISYARRYCFAGSFRELLGFNAGFVRRFIRIIFPVVCNEVFWSLGVTAQNIIFARTNTDAIAAFNITNTLNQLTWVVFIGLGNGAAVLIGKKIGEGSEAEARDYADRVSTFVPLAAAGAAFILIPLSRLLPFLFKVNPPVLSAAAAMFIILGCTYPFKAFNMTAIVGICRAGGDTVFCVIYDLVFMWTLALPAGAAASYFFHAPVWLIYLCIVSEEPIKAILGVIRVRSGKWLRNVTM
jgi:putative MATE family efflux protein